MKSKKEQIRGIMGGEYGWELVQRIVMDRIKSGGSGVEDLRRLMAQAVLVAGCEGDDEGAKAVIVEVLTTRHQEVCTKYGWDWTLKGSINYPLQEMRRSIIKAYKPGADGAVGVRSEGSEEEFWEVVRVVPALLKEVEGTHEAAGRMKRETELLKVVPDLDEYEQADLVGKIKRGFLELGDDTFYSVLRNMDLVGKIRRDWNRKEVGHGIWRGLEHHKFGMEGEDGYKQWNQRVQGFEEKYGEKIDKLGKGIGAGLLLTKLLENASGLEPASADAKLLKDMMRKYPEEEKAMLEFCGREINDAAFEERREDFDAGVMDLYDKLKEDKDWTSIRRLYNWSGKLTLPAPAGIADLAGSEKLEIWINENAYAAERRAQLSKARNRRCGKEQLESLVNDVMEVEKLGNVGLTSAYKKLCTSWLRKKDTGRRPYRVDDPLAWREMREEVKVLFEEYDDQGESKVAERISQRFEEEERKCRFAYYRLRGVDRDDLNECLVTDYEGYGLPGVEWDSTAGKLLAKICEVDARSVAGEEEVNEGVRAKVWGELESIVERIEAISARDEDIKTATERVRSHLGDEGTKDQIALVGCVKVLQKLSETLVFEEQRRGSSVEYRWKDKKAIRLLSILREVETLQKKVTALPWKWVGGAPEPAKESERSTAKLCAHLYALKMRLRRREGSLTSVMDLGSRTYQFWTKVRCETRSEELKRQVEKEEGTDGGMTFGELAKKIAADLSECVDEQIMKVEEIGMVLKGQTPDGFFYKDKHVRCCLRDIALSELKEKGREYLKVQAMKTAEGGGVELLPLSSRARTGISKGNAGSVRAPGDGGSKQP